MSTDGCLYVLDWYDRYHCYQDANRDPKGVDRLKGRLYRIRYGATPRAPKFDLAAETSAFARERFPGGSVEVKRDLEKLGGIYYRVSRDGSLLGWVVDAYRTIYCPVCHDAQLLVAVAAQPELKVLGVRPVRALERYGKPLPEARLRPFLGQFEGLKPGSPRGIDAVSGATKTSLAYEKAVKQVLQVLRDRMRPSEAAGGGR